MIGLRAPTGTGLLKEPSCSIYRKDLDLIDHSILIRKLCMLEVPNSIVNWIIDFCQTDLRKSNLVKDMYQSGNLSPQASPREPN